jgi:hypothetical protein
MISPFIIPDLVDLYVLSIEEYWGDWKKTGVNLLKNWGMLTLSQCKNWQRDSFNYACTNDLTSMVWAKSLMMNSCDVLFVERIDKKFNDLGLYKQGDITWLKIVLDDMFTTSNTGVTTLQGFFRTFAKEGIAKVPNEDVHAAMDQTVAITERLVEVSALPSECTCHILEGFTWCSVNVFKKTFAHLLVAERLQQLQTLINRNDSTRMTVSRSCANRPTVYSILWMYQMSGIFHRNIALLLVLIAGILIMASLNAPSLSTRNRSTRPRLSSPRAEVVVVTELDAGAEAALQDDALGIVIKPIPVAGGWAMMLRCLHCLTWTVA